MLNRLCARRRGDVDSAYMLSIKIVSVYNSLAAESLPLYYIFNTFTQALVYKRYNFKDTLCT